MSEWAVEESEFFASRFKRYQKKHPNETLAVLNNLDTYMGALKRGVAPAQISGGFIHPEVQGVVALDQKGARGRPRQTRLYIYALVEQSTVYLITIGDKNSQKRDIADCRDFMKKLRKEG